MEWLLGADAWWRIPLSALGVYVAVIAATRLNGLRTLSKMSSFDFAITVAIGTLVASTILNARPSLAEAVLGLASLVILQRVVAALRHRDALYGLVDNRPRLLVRDGVPLERVMRRARVTMDDVRAKAREAGVHDLGDLEAVVLETTGDLSIVRREPGRTLSEQMLENVRDQ